ncbi:PDZ domain-containing protein, partial [Streptomyces sp. NPDC023723]
MEQTVSEQAVLRPKPMPGRDPGGGTGPVAARQPKRRRRRRSVTVLCGLLAGTVLVLAGAGIGAMGSTVLGVGMPAEPRQRGGAAAPAATVAAATPRAA